MNDHTGMFKNLVAVELKMRIQYGEDILIIAEILKKLHFQNHFQNRFQKPFSKPWKMFRLRR